MRNFIFIIILLEVIFMVSPVPYQEKSTKWELKTTLAEGEQINATMSDDGKVYAIYQGFSPENIQIMDIDRNLISEINTQLQTEDTTIHGINLSYTGKYLAAIYHQSQYPERVLRIWDTVLEEIALEIPNTSSFLFGVNKNWVMLSTYGDEPGDKQGSSIIYNLDERIEKARLIGENSGRFTDINIEGTKALMIGNDGVFYAIDLEKSFAKLRISDIEEYDGFQFSESINGYFYTSDIVILDTISNRGFNVSVFQLSNEETSHIKDIYYFTPNNPIIAPNLFGFQNLYEYGIELLDPISEKVFFKEDQNWEYLAISPDSKWIVSYEAFEETLRIYSYPSMMMVSQIENCYYCYQLKFNDKSTQFMTISDDEAVAKVLIFELIE